MQFVLMDLILITFILKIHEDWIELKLVVENFHELILLKF